MKVCGACKQEYSIDDFAINPTKPDGRQWQCKSCQAKYRKEHYEKNKKRYKDKSKRNREEYKRQYYEWLKTKSCVDCGNNDMRVLEQDHLCDKNFDISSKIGSMTLNSLMNELEKCETVCANCHRIRTIERGEWFRHYAALVK